MPDPIPRLTALTLEGMKGDPRRAIVQGYQAAYFAGIKERTGIMPRGLSRIERAELKAILKPQLERFDAYQAEGADSEARTVMYARASGALYYAGRTGGAVPSYPRDGSTKCLSNCRCSLEERDDGWHWILGGQDHCSDCTQRASDWAPYRG